MLTPDEKVIIEKFACGDKTLREAAIHIYRVHVRDWISLERCSNSVHMSFMSEVDSPVPDLYLRSIYRKQLNCWHGAE